MDLQMPESGENRAMLGQTLASELRIKIYKEISATQNEIGEAIDSIMMTCREPSRGLNDTRIAEARELDSSGGLISFLQERPTLSAALLSVAAASVALIAFLIKNKR